MIPHSSAYPQLPPNGSNLSFAIPLSQPPAPLPRYVPLRPTIPFVTIRPVQMPYAPESEPPALRSFEDALRPITTTTSLVQSIWQYFRPPLPPAPAPIAPFENSQAYATLINEESSLWARLSVEALFSEANSERLSQIARHKIKLETARSKRKNQIELLNILQNKTIQFLSTIPGTVEHARRAQSLRDRWDFLPWHKNTEEQQAKIDAFAQEQAKTAEQIQAIENDLKTPQNAVQRIYQSLFPPRLVQKYLTRQASDLLNQISEQARALQSKEIASQAAEIKARQAINRKLSDLEAPAPTNADFIRQNPFYNRFQCIHRGGDLLKGEGEFVILESSHPIAEGIDIQNFAHLVPIEAKEWTNGHKEYKGSSTKIIDKITAPDPVLKADLVNGKADRSRNGKLQLYKIPVDHCANAFVDVVSFGSRQRYGMEQNKLVFENRDWGKGQSTPEEKARTAALQRMQGLLIIQEFSKRVFENRLRDLEFKHFNNSIAFLRSLQVNDLANEANTGYLHDPFFNHHLTLFNEIVKEPLLQTYVLDQHAQKKTAEILDGKKYQWGTNKEGPSKLRSILEPIKNLNRESTTLITLLNDDNLAQNDSRWNWVIQQITEIQTAAQKTLQIIPESELSNPQFFTPNNDKEDRNQKIVQWMGTSVTKIRDLYLATKKYELISRTAVLEDLMSLAKQRPEYKAEQAAPPRGNLTSRFASLVSSSFVRRSRPPESNEQPVTPLFENIESSLRRYSTALPIRFSTHSDSYGEILKGLPWGKQTLQSVEHYQDSIKALDQKELEKIEFATEVLSKPYAEARRAVFDPSQPDEPVQPD